MKWLILSLPFLLFSYTNAFAQTIENPVFDRTDMSQLHIKKVVLSSDTTYVYCSFFAEANTWANISGETYLLTYPSNEKLKLIKSKGLPISPEERDFSFAQECEVLFYFPSIKESSHFDFIESPERQAFNIYGVSLISQIKNVCQESDYNHYSKMADFWSSAGDSAKAFDFKKKEIEASKCIYGQKSLLYIIGLYNLSDLYYNYGDINGSVYWKEKAVKLCVEINRRLIKEGNLQAEKLYYLQDLDYFYGLQGAACKYYMERNRWKEAKEIITNTYALIKEIDDTSIYIPLAEYYVGYTSYFMKDEEDAEKYFMLSYDSFQRHTEAQLYPAYAELLSMISLLYYGMGEINKGYQYALKACDASKKISGEKSKEYGYALTTLSNAEMMLNMKDDGLLHAEMASEIIENAEDVSSEEKEIYRERILSIRAIYNRNVNTHTKNTELNSSNVPVFTFDAFNDVLAGNFDVAIEKLNNVKDYQEKNFKSIGLYNYINTIVLLSDALTQIGRYNEADSTLDSAIGILQYNNVKTNMIRHIYSSKGLLYYVLNDTRSSIWWYKQAIELFHQVNDRSISYARLLSNIALLYTRMGFYKEANERLDEAFEICNSFYGKDINSSDYYLILNNIATNYAKMGDYDKGKEVYNLIINDATTKRNQRAKALAMSNLSEIHIVTKDFQNAKKLIEEALLLDEDGYIKDMLDFNYLFCLCMERDPEIIEKLFAYNENAKNNLTEIFGRFSELEREKYWNQWSEQMVFLNNLTLSLFETNDIKQMAYNNALFTKSMLINSGRLLENIVKQSSYTKERYSIMQQYKAKLTQKGLLNDSLDSYRRKISQLEKQIVSSIPDFGEKLRNQFKSYNDVKNMLSDNEVAIEFIFIPKVEIPIENSKLSYGALILKKHDDSPQFVSLCSEDQLKELLCVGDSTNQYDPNHIYSTTNDTLYQILWAKMAPYIGDAETIYYSPTGLINRINLSAISDGTRRLGDSYNLYEVSTTACIHEKERRTAVLDKNAIIYGDINYNEELEKMEKMAQVYNTYSSGLLLATRSLKRGTWDLLPGTREEIDSISNIAKENGLSVNVYSMDNANEESFKSIDGRSPYIIHIATHGFYFPNETTTLTNYFNDLGSYTYGDRSMQYSGLLFAGANNAWTGNLTNNSVEDGILTAEEVSRIDLSHTNLVVLSACETGLGDVDKINGVFGLQRGFKRAGVESVLMSLWKVDDTATRILMVEFYKNLMNGKSKHQSFKDAQKYLRQFDNGKYDKPEYWASFIMLDGLN